MEEKTCPNCGKVFEARHGNQKYCSSQCAHAYRVRLWRAANPDRVREYNRSYYAKKREERINDARQHYHENPDRQREAQKKWLAANPEYHAEYYRKNRDRILAQRDPEYQRRYYQQNRERIAEQRRQRREAMKEAKPTEE